MPKLPSARDVSPVSPRVAADPGVRAPAQAFESPLQIASQEFQPAAEAFAKVALQQENRRDTVDRSSRINQFSREADAELRRLNTEADLSDEEVLRQFGSFLSEKRSKLIEDHRGSKDSAANLTLRLQDVESDAIGRASAISTKIGREKVVKTFGDALSPLVLKASQDPKLENIDQLFTGLETQISDIRAALDPTEEENFRQTGRQQIVLSAVDTLIARGRVETAESMLRDGKLSQFLPPDTQRDMNRRIESVRFAREETLRKIAQAEAVVGRPLSDKERLGIIGLGGEDKLIEVGDPTSPTGSRLIRESEALGKPGKPRSPLVNIEQPQIGSIPPGFQVVRDPKNTNVMRMEPIPGGPAEAEINAASQKKVEQQRQLSRQSKIVVRDIDRAMSIIDSAMLGSAAGGVAGSLSFVPGTPAFKLERQLDSIKARVSFDSLQQMRAASPTGGALGSVAVKELDLLTSTLGSLDVRQDDEILRENLGQIRELYLDAWFGTPDEHKAAIDDGRMTPAQSKRLMEERKKVGFDAIGRSLDAEEKQDDLDADDILAMSLDQITALSDEQIDKLNAKQQKALDKRLKELGR